MAMRRLHALALGVLATLLAGCAGSSDDTAPATGDRVAITDVSPASAPADIARAFAVTVAYTLDSVANGEINVGFNTTSAALYTLVLTDSTISRGSGQKRYTAIATPRDWGSSGTFGVYVVLSVFPHTEPLVPLADDIAPIPIGAVPAAARSAADEGP